MSTPDLWAVLHGIVFGGTFLLGFGAGFAALFSLRTEWMTEEGRSVRTNRLPTYAWIMAISVWAAVVAGTFFVYPTYRAPPPPGTTDLLAYPRSFLLADPGLAFWHHFGMEWKEHVSWLAPILATVVAFILTRYRNQIAQNAELRKAALLFYFFAFTASGIGGLLGAFINKAVPIP